MPRRSGLNVTEVEWPVSAIGVAIAIRAAALAAYALDHDPEGRVAEAAPGRESILDAVLPL